MMIMEMKFRQLTKSKTAKSSLLLDALLHSNNELCINVIKIEIFVDTADGNR